LAAPVIEQVSTSVYLPGWPKKLLFRDVLKCRLRSLLSHILGILETLLYLYARLTTPPPHQTLLPEKFSDQMVKI
jgi:hypothetical protein